MEKMSYHVVRDWLATVASNAPHTDHRKLTTCFSAMESPCSDFDLQLGHQIWVSGTVQLVAAGQAALLHRLLLKDTPAFRKEATS